MQDLVVNLLIGIIGAVVGGLLAGLVGIAAYGLLGEIIIATLGAMHLHLAAHPLTIAAGTLILGAPRKRTSYTLKGGHHGV